MNKIIILAITSIIISQPVFAAKQFKCWRSDEGVKECGTYVPPKYSQKRIETRGESGRVVEIRERAKTQEEIKEAERLAKIKKSEDEKIAAQNEKDSILLKTFSRELDITMLRDSKVKVIDGIITVTNSNKKTLAKNLNKLKKRAGKNPAAPIAASIKRIENRISKKDKSIELKRAEQEEIRQKFEIDLQRFRILKNK